jgi:hypothetical protein
MNMLIVAFWIQFHPEDGRGTLLRNVDNNLQDHGVTSQKTAIHIIYA